MRAVHAIVHVDYLDVLVFQLVDQNRDRIEAVVRVGVTRCHFAAGRTGESGYARRDPSCRVRCVYVDARRFRVCASDTVHGHARLVTA